MLKIIKYLGTSLITNLLTQKGHYTEQHTYCGRRLLIYHISAVWDVYIDHFSVIALHWIAYCDVRKPFGSLLLITNLMYGKLMASQSHRRRRKHHQQTDGRYHWESNVMTGADGDYVQLMIGGFKRIITPQ